MFFKEITRLLSFKGCPSSLSMSVRHIRTIKATTRPNPRIENEINDQDKVVLTDDGRTIVCWHPEPKFEYSMSKPIPLETIPQDSNLKVQSLYPVRELFRPKYELLMIRELMQITHTAKYRWFPKQRRLRYKAMNPLIQKRDRDYL